MVGQHIVTETVRRLVMPSISRLTHSELLLLVSTLLWCLCSIRVRVALDHSDGAVLDVYETCNDCESRNATVTTGRSLKLQKDEGSKEGGGEEDERGNEVGG
ncbi:hypothetical protein BCV69DRAFT_7898 [Microstroma glucosiphilum]|uniref:Uncharacterized protein n=1 Tax=Pseudomicrostroma glucosiphilum TaxID=1684307 RepID=A0A316UEQ7_9BASI|nr:hypothetical protein BCV69DRAFT_7898 [Pseudomicrostroma glucosiphilum]PWN23702.1 hypothetical protein BCV69DRAFT_7898 [Pseudomicrostroma glucosiphilum]